MLSGQYIEFISRPDHFGFAGFRYVLEDNDGAQDTADVEIYFAPVNDAPRNRDSRTPAKLEETTEFTVDQLMASVYDVEGDAFEFVGLTIAADGNATFNVFETFDEDTGIISYTPFWLAAASITFDVIDARGAEAELEFGIFVRPQNVGPDARNDYGLRMLEDDVILIDPASLLINDTDADGDTVVFQEVERFAENGKVRLTDDGMIEFIARPNFNGTGSFEYTVNDGRGGTGTAEVFITILPRNDAPEVRNDVVAGLEDGPQFVIPAEAFGNDSDLNGDVLFFQQTALLGVFDKRFLAEDYTVEAKSGNNTDLPDWLSFDAATLTFSGIVPEDQETDTEVAVFLSDPVSGAVHPFRFSFDAGDAGSLATGISVEDDVLGGFELREAFSWTPDANGDDVVTFDISAGSFEASIIGGRPLPDWLSFDADTRSFAPSGFDPDPDAGLARVQVVYTPDPDALSELEDNQFRATNGGFKVEFVLDPAEPLDPAINALLAGDPALEAGSLFGIDLAGVAGLTVSRESGAPLNSWLSFDAATLTFSGMPPSNYVGAVPVRIDVPAGGGLPEWSIITEVVVDETFIINPNIESVSVFGLPERITLDIPEDYNGSVALTYFAADEKGGVSEGPAIIVFNVLAQRELPVAGADTVDLFENGSVTFAVSDLLDNDRDDDGDVLRVHEIGTPANGGLMLTLSVVQIAPPASLAPLAGGTWSADLASGEAVPEWMSLDAATGQITATVPLNVLGAFEIVFTNTDGTTTQSASETTALDGNEGATVTYVPDAGFAGTDPISYLLSDNSDGTSEGLVALEVTSLLDPPVAATDDVIVQEDGILVLTPADLLANDFDVDGDTIRFLGVGDAVDGTVSFDGTNITFTPAPDFSGFASFGYTITDDTHGDSSGLVEVRVTSTNQRPEAVAGVLANVEDIPFEFTLADLLANDTDPDGDAVSFVSMQTSVPGGRILELPGGRYQFVPDENVNGEINFAYTVTDGRLTDRGLITFEIEAVNDAPIGNPDGPFIGEQDAPFAIDFADLLFNDRDVEGNDFSIVSVFDGDNGTVEMVGNTAVFTGRAGYFGDGGFHYRVTDEFGATDTGYATVLVLPLFAVPVAVSDTGFEILEDSFLDIDPAALMANDDIPLGSEVLFLGLTGPGVTELENGLFRVAPAADFFWHADAELCADQRDRI